MNIEELIQDLKSSNLDTVKNAAGTICNICRNNEENKKAVGENGGLEALVDAIERSNLQKNTHAIYECVLAITSLAMNCKL